MAKTRITVEIDPVDKILAKRNMEPGGQAELFLTNEVVRISDPYVPMQTGMMKNTVQVEPGKATYPQIYSEVQYDKNRGTGRRGAHWDVRAMADRALEVVRSVARFIGGRPG